MADKISLDERFEDLEYEPSDSEEEYTKEEKQLLKNVRQRGKKKDTQQEVLAFDDGSSESDGDDGNQVEAEEYNDNLIDNSDIEDEQDDGEIPDAKAWGKRRSAYYYTDFVDQDYSTYNEKDEELALQEEEEAKAIQQRLAQQLDEIDFSLDIYADSNKEDQVVTAIAEKNDVTEVKLKRDLENLSERQKQQLFKKDSPEFYGLVQDFEKYFQESQKILQPFLENIKNYDVQSPTIPFVTTMNNVIITYCTNIVFYLTLKAKRTSVKNHPVTKRLVQIRQILQQLEQKYNESVKNELLKVIEMIEAGSKITFKLPSSDNLNGMGNKKKMVKSVHFEDDKMDRTIDDKEEEGAEKDEEDEIMEEGDERRGITYQIAKNKGLTPHRKKELKNPRVKHRNKYRKALIRRKGAVRTVRKELQRYGGEISGIKATVKKSIKIKS